LADELRQAFSVESELIPGKGGIFDVTVDDKLVFSKFQTGRFPKAGEISEKIKGA
jgi:selenoprotein W-related protein